MSPGGFSGLAQLILEGGENSARRTERLGATIGGALSDLGATLLGKKQRREEQAYRDKRDAVSDARAEADMTFRQDERLYQRGRDLKADTRNETLDALAMGDKLADNARADRLAGIQDQELALKMADAKTQRGQGPALLALAASKRQQAEALMANGDEPGAMAAMEESTRATRAASVLVGGAGGFGGPGAEPQGQPAARGLGRASLPTGTQPNLPEIRDVGGVAQPNMPDAKSLLDYIETERKSTDAALLRLPDKTEAQRAVVDRARKARDRSLTILQSHATRMAMAEKVEGEQKQAAAEEQFGQYLGGMGHSPQDVQAGLQGVRGGASPESVAVRLDERRTRDKTQAPKDQTPQAAADAIGKIMDEAQKKIAALDAHYAGLEKPDWGEKEWRVAAAREEMVMDIARQPDALARAFPLSDTATQAILLEAVGGNPAEAAVKVAADWRRLNPNAPPEEASRLKAMLKAAVAARLTPAQGR